MSRYSLKFDLYDYIFLTGKCNLDYLKRSNIYIGSSVGAKRIEVNSYRDLMPYYAYVISSAGYNPDGATIYLMEESWPDYQIREFGDSYGVYDSCKKQLDGDIKKYDAGELKSPDLRE